MLRSNVTAAPSTIAVIIPRLHRLLAIAVAALAWLCVVEPAGAHPGHGADAPAHSSARYAHNSARYAPSHAGTLAVQESLSRAHDPAVSTSTPCPGDSGGSCCCEVPKATPRTQPPLVSTQASYVVHAIPLTLITVVGSRESPVPSMARATLAHACRAPPSPV